MITRLVAVAAVHAALVLGMSSAALAQTPMSKAKRTSESMEPALVHADQVSAAQQKLTALQARTGKRPNIVWLLVDDMGYGDPGAFGGAARRSAPRRPIWTGWRAKGSS